MAMSRDENAEQDHNIKIYKSFDRVEQLKNLGTTLTNQNSIQEEIESRLKPGNAYHHLVQNILPCSLIPKNIKIKTYRTRILSDVLYGCKIWSITEGRNVG
jgi:hypothetical protein